MGVVGLVTRLWWACWVSCVRWVMWRQWVSWILWVWLVTSGKESLLKTVCSRMNIIIRPTTFNRKWQSWLMCSSLLSRQYYESSPKHDKAETLMWSFLWFIALYLGMLLYSTLLHLRLYLLLNMFPFNVFLFSFSGTLLILLIHWHYTIRLWISVVDTKALLTPLESL